MSAALRTEYRKLVTTRLWWVLVVGSAGYMAFLGAVMAFAFTAPDAAGQTSRDGRADRRRRPRPDRLRPGDRRSGTSSRSSSARCR